MTITRREEEKRHNNNTGRERRGKANNPMFVGYLHRRELLDNDPNVNFRLVTVTRGMIGGSQALGVHEKGKGEGS